MTNSVIPKFLITTSLVIYLLISNYGSVAQDNSVQNSFFGVQVGFLELQGLYEFKLTPSISLRNEIGLVGSFGSTNGEVSSYILTPTLRVEPRWYYSLNARASNGKSIARNSSLFVSLPATFSSYQYAITNHIYNSSYNTLSFIPTWGYRKSFSKALNFELGIGMGYMYNFKNESHADYGDFTMNALLRCGFDFRVR